MKIPNAAFGILVVSALVLCASHDARAADINGVWVSDATLCQKVFEKSGNSVTFAKYSDLYGSGFIIDGNQIKGRMATCTIKARREQGPLVNLIAVCSTDIAIDTMQFRLKMDGPNKVVREFPGMPDLEMNYERCSP